MIQQPKPRKVAEILNIHKCELRHGFHGFSPIARQKLILIRANSCNSCLNFAVKQFATITVIGRDKTGVIARVTNFLFEQKANIEALEEQVTRGQFSMTLQASWKSSELKYGSLRTGLEKLAAQLGMEIKVRFTEPNRRQKFAIMVTKETHCFDALMAAKLKADAELVIGNYNDFAPRVKKLKLPFAHINWNDRAKAEDRALQLLEENEIDFIVLARFMKILSPNFVWRYKNKIINIHPSLLPSFPGPQAYRQAYESGVKIAGVTRLLFRCGWTKARSFRKAHLSSVWEWN
jgi:formyltetrahydrofolate deformylase